MFPNIPEMTGAMQGDTVHAISNDIRKNMQHQSLLCSRTHSQAADVIFVDWRGGTTQVQTWIFNPPEHLDSDC